MQLDRHRFQLIGCNVLAFQGEHLADQDGAEDQHESHDQLEPHLLAVQKHAEQHAEHRFQTEEQRRCAGGTCASATFWMTSATHDAKMTR